MDGNITGVSRPDFWEPPIEGLDSAFESGIGPMANLLPIPILVMWSPGGEFSYHEAYLKRLSTPGVPKVAINATAVSKVMCPKRANRIPLRFPWVSGKAMSVVRA